MILTCDNCQTRYLVPGHALTEHGRRVRCSHCGHEWFQEPEDIDDTLGEDENDEDVPEIISFDDDHTDADDESEQNYEEIPESVRPEPDEPVPALSQKAQAQAWTGYAAAAAVFVIVLGLLLALHKPLARLWEPLAGLYQMAGIELPVRGETLIIENVNATADINSEGVQVLRIKGKIVNLDVEKDIKVPPVEARLLKKDGSVTDRWLIELQSDIVGAGADMSFFSSYPGLPADIAEVNIRLLAE